MVNTFVVYYDPKISLRENFLINARYLDKVRLPNQRREALMVLRSILKLKGMAEILNNPVPDDPYEWYDWIRIVIKDYKEKSKKDKKFLVYQNRQWRWVDESQKLYDIHHKDNQWMKKYKFLERDGAKMESEREDGESGGNDEIQFFDKKSEPSKKLLRSECLLEDDFKISFGYIYHPCVLQWLGSIEALRLYLNCCIDVSIERGVKNDMNYEIIDEEKIVVPPWLLDHEEIILRHRSILLQKEVTRKEPEWYQKIDIFTSAPEVKAYFWPYAKKCASVQGIADDKMKYKNRL